MTGLAEPLATIVVSPRDTFTHTMRCLRRLLECTPAPRRILYVDGGSPAPVARELAASAVAEDFALLRSDCVLTPNRARNLALALLPVDDAPAWTAFVDNDAYVEPGGWSDSGRVVTTPARPRSSRCSASASPAANASTWRGRGRSRRRHGGASARRSRTCWASSRSSPTRDDDRRPLRHVRVPRGARRPATLAGGRGRSTRSCRPCSSTSTSASRCGPGGGEIWFEPTVEVTYLPGDVGRRRPALLRDTVERRRGTAPASTGSGTSGGSRRTTRRRDRTSSSARGCARGRTGPTGRRSSRWPGRRDRYPRRSVDRVAQPTRCDGTGAGRGERTAAAGAPSGLGSGPDRAGEVTVDA